MSANRVVTVSGACGGMGYVTSMPATPEAVLERICQENLAVYRESAGRLQEDVS